jgi:S-adenosylmethionine/arginine decarboxylase-like enzyme
LFTADCAGQSPFVLDDLEELEHRLARCLEAFGLAPAVWGRHRFEPQGVSLFGLGRLARVALHTWPELCSATVDLWTADSRGATALRSCATVFSPSVRPVSVGNGGVVTAGEHAILHRGGAEMVANESARHSRIHFLAGEHVDVHGALLDEAMHTHVAFGDQHDPGQ